MSNNETEPLWLSSANDHIHEARVEEAEEPALFGTGKLSLKGEVSDDFPSPRIDIESYGSMADSVASSSKTPASKKKPASSVFDAPDSDAEVDDQSSVTEEDSKITAALETKPHMPKRICCLEFFRIFSGVVVTAFLGLLVTQIIPLWLGGVKSQTYFDLALKGYVTLFCLVFILVEVNAPLPFLRDSDLLQTFLSRGFIYSFLGLICLQEAYSDRVKDMVSAHASNGSDEFHVAWASLFMEISSWIMFSSGVFYMLMGICCLKKTRDKLSAKDRKLWKKYRRELKEWKRLNPR